MNEETTDQEKDAEDQKSDDKDDSVKTEESDEIGEAISQQGEDPKADSNDKNGELDHQEAFVKYLASMKAGSKLYKQEELLTKKDELSENAIVLVVGIGESSAKIQYAFDGSNTGIELAVAYAKTEDIVALTEEEVSSWQTEAHEFYVQSGEYILVPVRVLEKEETDEESLTKNSEKVDATDTELNEDEITEPQVEIVVDEENVEEVEIDETLEDAGVALTEAEIEEDEELEETSIDDTLLESVTTEGYFVIDDTGAIIEYTGSAASIIIPEQIDGISVTSLHEGLFQDTTVEDVTLPSAITKIPASLFAGCTSLVTVSNMEGVTEIDYSAFSNCTSLRAISLPSSLTKIGHDAFNGCASLKTISMPDGVTEVGEGAFSGCTSLVDVKMSNGLNKIGASAFKNCRSMTDIVIPSAVTYVGNSAFEGCSAANTITLSPAMTSIAAKTFKDCASIKDLVVPSSVTSIGAEAFSGCNALEIAELPVSVESIGARAFSGTSGDLLLFVYNSNAVIATDGLGTTGNVLGYNDSTAHKHADAHTNQKFVNIEANFFVERCYTILLERPSDRGGRLSHLKALISGKTGAGQIVSGFVESGEFKRKEYSNSDGLEKLYQTMMNRASDAGGKANWLSYLDAGCTFSFVVKGFTSSGEFSRLCAKYYVKPGSVSVKYNRDVNGLVTKFVARCYNEALGRSADVGGLEAWCGQINSGRMSAAQVAAGFALSGEAQRKYPGNEQFVEMLYHLYMGRSSDAGGKKNWVNAIKAGMTRAAVCDGFGKSGEFKRIAAKYKVN